MNELLGLSGRRMAVHVGVWDRRAELEAHLIVLTMSASVEEG